MRRFGYSITLALAALLAMGEVAQAATEITVWHAYRGQERQGLEQIAQTFNAAREDIAIRLLPIPYDAFADKLTATIPRGQGPDLFIFAQDRIGDWAASDLIEPVGFWVDEAARAAYLEPTIEALTYDDQLFGLPIAFKMLALFYNRALLPTPPASTDEMIAMGRKLTDAKAGEFGLVYENASFYHQAMWMHAFGGRVFSKRGRPQLDGDGVVKSMAFARSLAAEAGIMPEEITSTLVTDLFNRGKAAMVINGSGFRGELDPKIDYGLAVLPAVSSVGRRAAPFLTVEGVIMSAQCQAKMKAFEVMQYLTGVEAGVVMATQGAQPSARREVYDHPRVQADASLLVFKEQLQFTVPMPNMPAMRAVWSPAATAMNKVINGHATPADAMRVAQQELTKLLKGARR